VWPAWLLGINEAVVAASKAIKKIRMVGLELPTGLPEENGGNPKLTVTLTAARLFAVPAQYANANGGNDATAVVSASKRQIMMKQYTLAMFHSFLKPAGRRWVLKPGDSYCG
jgi:hypothetical protein